MIFCHLFQLHKKNFDRYGHHVLTTGLHLSHCQVSRPALLPTQSSTQPLHGITFLGLNRQGKFPTHRHVNNARNYTSTPPVRCDGRDLLKYKNNFTFTFSQRTILYIKSFKHEVLPNNV
jgi:hypothetical protein